MMKRPRITLKNLSFLLVLALLSGAAFCFVPLAAHAEEATTTATTTETTEETKCVDEELANTLAKADTARFARVLAVTWGAGDQIRKAQAESPMKNSRGDIGLKYCFKDITSIYDSLMDILDKEILGPIWKAIMYLFQQISSKVCEYVLSALDALMEMICLPLPDISMPNLSLPGLDSVSCDGRSLNDYVRVELAEPFDLRRLIIPQEMMSLPLALKKPSSGRRKSLFKDVLGSE